MQVMKYKGKIDWLPIAVITVVLLVVGWFCWLYFWPVTHQRTAIITGAAVHWDKSKMRVYIFGPLHWKLDEVALRKEGNTIHVNAIQFRYAPTAEKWSGGTGGATYGGWTEAMELVPGKYKLVFKRAIKDYISDIDLELTNAQEHVESYGVLDQYYDNTIALSGDPRSKRKWILGLKTAKQADGYNWLKE